MKENVTTFVFPDGEELVAKSIIVQPTYRDGQLLIVMDKNTSVFLEYKYDEETLDKIEKLCNSDQICQIKMKFPNPDSDTVHNLKITWQDMGCKRPCEKVTLYGYLVDN